MGLNIAPTLNILGERRIELALAQGGLGQLTHIALGRGQYNPTGTEAGLVDEVARAQIETVSPGDGHVEITATVVAPEDFTVGEVAFLLDDGTPFAIWSEDPALQYPDLDLATGEQIIENGVPQTRAGRALASVAAGTEIPFRYVIDIGVYGPDRVTVVAQPLNEAYALLANKLARLTTPEDFGAVGDGVADDAAAFEMAAQTAAQDGKPFEATKTYRFGRPVVIQVGSRTFCASGEMIGDFDPALGPVLTLYHRSTGGVTADACVLGDVRWDEFTVEDPVSLRLAGLKGANVRIHNADHIELFASNDPAMIAPFGATPVDSNAYNHINITSCGTLSFAGYGVGAWVNQNTVHVERITGRAVRPGRVKFFGEYGHNKNIIQGGTLEGPAEISIERGNTNSLRDLRLERSAGQMLDITFGEDAHDNEVEAAWVSAPTYANMPYGDLSGLVNVDDPSGLNVVHHRQERLSVDVPLLGLNTASGWIGRVGNNELSGHRDATTFPNLRNVESRIGGSFAVINSYNTVFCDFAQQFQLEPGLMVVMRSDQAYWRMLIHCFDVNGNSIDVEPAEPAFAGPSLKWNTNSAGKGYYTVEANVAWQMFISQPHDTVKFFSVEVLSGNGVAGATFRRLDVGIRAPKSYESPGMRRAVGWLGAERMRGQAVSYWSDTDIDMTQVEAGIPAFKINGTERKINLARTTHVVTAVNGSSLTVHPGVGAAPNMAGISENRVRYRSGGGAEALADVASASGTTITLATPVADIVPGSPIVYASTLTHA